MSHIPNDDLRYQVCWRKTTDGAGEYRTLTRTNDLATARDWRDKWRKSDSCADIWIMDRKTKQVRT